MNYKVGQRVSYYRYGGEIHKGKITRIKGDEVYIKQGYSTPCVDKGEIIKVHRFWFIAPTIMSIGVIGFMALLFGFVYKTMSEYEPPQTPQLGSYQRCMNWIEGTYDTINDTVGASYAHEDTPTGNLKELLDHCMTNIDK